MTDRTPRGLFVTATDTDVGKTFVTALAVRELREAGHAVGAYKPACSGAIETEDGLVWNDVEVLHESLGHEFPRERISPQRFIAPLAPPVAAAKEGLEVDPKQLRAGLEWWLGHVDVLLVEGVGGFLCPLWSTGLVADFAETAGFPVLVVARAGLGTINHTLLTLEAIRSRGLEVAGVLLNSANRPESPGEDVAAAESNAREIERYGDVRVLGHLPWSPNLRDHSDAPTIDWLALVGPRRT